MKALLVSALLVHALPSPALAQVGTPYCFGQSCPCGNDDPTAGCGNLGSDGSASTGALLTATGTADVFFDDLVLAVSGMQANQMGIVYMGGAQLSLPFGDGLRCVGAGGVGVHRFPVRSADATGHFAETALVATSQGFSAPGVIAAGDTWYFQSWYRDPGGPCGAQFNLSNAVPVTFTPAGSGGPIETQLVGNSLPAYPWFEFVRAMNQGADVRLALDPALFPFTLGQTADVYVVAAKTASEWAGDASLTDVRGGSSLYTFNGPNVIANTVLVDAGTLNGTVGTEIGVGYDLVLDFDQDGLLGPGDLVDGMSDEAGFYVVRDTAAPGPYAVVEDFFTADFFLTQNVYYPANIAALGELPLIAISHGNGHNYQWYDHIGYHMASYGYVVMSHRNNTQPGIQTCSLTTIENTEYFLGNLGAILGGVLDGHVDGDRIVWLGHSRGGEGVARAYDRIVDDGYPTTNFDASDLRLVSSIAPTDYLQTAGANPHAANYHLWVGTADADVSGVPNDEDRQSFHLAGRASNVKLVTSVYGAGHAVFHDGGGSWVATGPCLIDPPTAHAIMRGYFLPLVAHFVHGDIPSKDFLWRQYESFHPVGAPVANPCVVVNLEYKDGVEAGNQVVDDHQSQAATTTSSSGGAVTFDVTNAFEGRLDDNDTNFTWTPSDPMNGMTRALSTDFTSGVVFDWNQPSFYELEVVPAERDLSGFAFLSFRASQGTRHPNTTAVLEDLRFALALRDGSGTTSTISIATYGSGIEEPYQRTGAGTGAGWGNEYETVRVRLRDFLADGSDLDLADVAAIRFEFGGAGESPEGRLGLDDVQITRD